MTAPRSTASARRFSRRTPRAPCRGETLAEGRFLSYIDVDRHQNVCVIGDYLAQTAFRGDALGKTISLSGVPYTVIGVLSKSGDSSEGSADDVIYIPYENAQRMGTGTMMMGTDEMFLLTSTSRDTASAAKGIVEKRLYKTYQSSDYYMVMTSAEMMDAMNTMMNTMMIVLVAIAAISLLVGGIGIMNIMLVSVTERTREIGIRKSLGAKQKDIRGQFVIEAGTTSAVGGVLGIVFGLLLARAATIAVGAIMSSSMNGITFSAVPTSFRHCCQLRRQRRHRRSVRLPARQQGGQAEPHRRPALRLIPADEKRPGDRSLFCAENFSENCSPSKLFPLPARLYSRTNGKDHEKRVTYPGKATDRLSRNGSGAVLPTGVQLPEKQGRALDAVQTAVCRALEKQGELKEPEALRAWFYHILVHVCMDVLRSRKRVTLIPPEALDAGSYEDPLPSDGTLAQRVDALPPEVGTIIKLRFYEDLSLKEISTVTGWNLNTVKTRLYTGLKKLRISMEGDQL